MSKKKSLAASRETLVKGRRAIGYRRIALNALFLIAAGCSSLDMQGVDPKAYYAAHPIKNRVTVRHMAIEAHFMPRLSTLSADEQQRLRSALRPLSPLAAQSVTLQLPDDGLFTPRSAYLTHLLLNLGFEKQKLQFTPVNDEKRNAVHIEIAYSEVIMPDCPDWKTSPITTYSNTRQGNFNCATEVNIGAMVADPADLVRGSGRISPDTARNAQVIEDYKAGKDFGATSSASGSSGASSSGSSPVSPTSSGSSSGSAP